MKILRSLPSRLIAASLVTLGITAALADSGDATTIKFSDPARPGTVKITVNSGDLRIRGTDTQEVSVTTELQPASSEQRADGLRVLTSSSAFSLTEKDNVVTLSYGSGVWGGGHDGDFSLTVPRNSNIVIASSFGGETEIEGIDGDIEVKNLNGEVKLTNISGGALVETMNGEIDVSVRELRADKPLSFTSMNGEVALRLPSTVKANVRLRTHNGSILTDFDEKSLVTKTESVGKGKRGGKEWSPEADEIRTVVRDAVRMGMEAARAATEAAREATREFHEHSDDDIVADAPMAPTPPLPPMTGGKIVSGTLNGGGTEIRITTMNGDVTLRKAAP